MPAFCDGVIAVAVVGQLPLPRPLRLLQLPVVADGQRLRVNDERMGGDDAGATSGRKA